MMVYDLVAPDGATRIHAASFETAALATLLLGEGGLGADPAPQTGESVPIFLFGGGPAWWRSRFGGSLEDALQRHRASLADALDSLEILDPGKGIHSLSPRILAERAQTMSATLRSRAPT